MPQRISSKPLLSTRLINSLQGSRLAKLLTNLARSLHDKAAGQTQWTGRRGALAKGLFEELVHLLFDAIHLAGLRKHRLNAGILI